MGTLLSAQTSINSLRAQRQRRPHDQFLWTLWASPVIWQLAVSRGEAAGLVDGQLSATLALVTRLVKVQYPESFTLIYILG